MMPELLEIQTASAKGEPMQSHTSIKGIKDQGLEDDRYAKGLGAWSKVRTDVPRHVTLIEAEQIAVAWVESGLKFNFELTRRNLLTQGILLNDMVGKQLRIGQDMIIEGVELCDPCARIGILSKDPDLKAGLEKALQNRGGLRAQIIQTGIIRVGDDIAILA